MTAGSFSEEILSRRESDLETKEAATNLPDQTPLRTVTELPQVGEECSDSEVAPMRKRPRAPMARLVSQESQYISSAGEDDDSDVQEIETKPPSVVEMEAEKVVPTLRNPLHDATLLSTHLRSLRLESELFPLRQLVARLMTNPLHNRRGLFNFPVDVKGLGLDDYKTIITKPMDLGTIKARLHAVAYNSRDEFAADVRLVFENAMTFNPPDNTVHISARALLTLFNEQYEIIQATNATLSTQVQEKPTSVSIQLPLPLPPRRRMASVKLSTPDCRTREAVSRVANPVTPLASLKSTPCYPKASTELVVTAKPYVTPMGNAQNPTVSPSETADLTPSEFESSAPSSTYPSATKLNIDTDKVAEAELKVAQKSLDQTNMGLSCIAEQPSLFHSDASMSLLPSSILELSPSIDICPLVLASTANASGSDCLGSLPQVEHHQWVDPGPQGTEKALKRAMNIAAKHAKHTCRSCLGRSCAMCNQGCLSHEPALLICTGANCSGAKIRKGAIYYIAKDGSRQFCQRCYSNLQAVLPHTSDQFESMGTAVRYKRDLLKRKNDEEVAEHWLTCVTCKEGIHKICAMFNEFTNSDPYYTCPTCFHTKNESSQKMSVQVLKKLKRDELYSFLSGTDIPVKLSEVLGSQERSPFRSEDLPETTISSFIEEKVRSRMDTPDYPNAGKTITVRIISDCSKFFKVPEVVRKHFRMQAEADNLENGVMPPTIVRYNSKAIMLFQKIDGLDVCIFCVYVQEYDCDDVYSEGADRGLQKKRVYIAYLDSVEHFRPRVCRTDVFHEILVAYLATARARGYETVHIWACPPSRGNSFVFWNHPASQRTPNKDRLVSWYHGVLSRAVEAGVVTDVQSMFESSFHDFMKSQGTDTDDDEPKKDGPELHQEGVLGGLLICPPLLDGDFWIEEAVRLHAANISRFLKSKSTGKEALSSSIVEDQRRCPALQVAALLRDTVMAHDSAAPFRKPVNAAALKLKDYHKIILHPMDLGTVYSRCFLGEFEKLKDVVSDVLLVFLNAMKYNPKGHSIHDFAVEMQEFFFSALDDLTRTWKIDGFQDCKESEHKWIRFNEASMSLDVRIEFTTEELVSIKPLATSTEIAEMKTTSDSTISVTNPTTFVATVISDVDVAPLMSTPLKSPNLELLAAPQLHVDIPLTQLPNSGCKRSPLSSPSSVRTSMLPEKKLEFLTGGPDAIHQRMVGDDVWLLDKRNPNPPKGSVNSKKNGKRKKWPAEATVDEPPQKRRRQSWLGREVGSSVRRLRTSFFTCSLTAKAIPTDQEEIKANHFDSYVASFHSRNQDSTSEVVSHLADARHALLEFSQFRNLEFDTLRRAKFSTSILLHHLHHDDAPGLIPICSTCQETIEDVRWHRVRRVVERHHSGRIPPTLRAQRIAEISIPEEIAEASHWGEELCSSCFSQQKKADDFIPLPVSFKT